MTADLAGLRAELTAAPAPPVSAGQMRPGTTRVSLTAPRASVPASLTEVAAEAVTVKLADVVVMGHPAEATTTSDLRRRVRDVRTTAR